MVSYGLLIENFFKKAYFGYMTIYGHVLGTRNWFVLVLSSKDNQHPNASWTLLAILCRSINKSDRLINRNPIYGHNHFHTFGTREPKKIEKRSRRILNDNNRVNIPE